MLKLYKLMIIDQIGKPRLHSSYLTKDRAEEALKYLDKDGHFVYIDIEVVEPKKPTLRIIK